jgi:endonuclease-3
MQPSEFALTIHKRLLDTYGIPEWRNPVSPLDELDEHEVIGAIRTAGLANQKGPRIQNMLREITAQRGELNLDFLEKLSTEEASDWLRGFKGVGPKTAAIVLQFSLGKPAFPVDTHIYRVTGRLGLRPQKMNADRAHTYLAELFPPQSYYAVHLNIIRLGREVCHARRPDCEFCPLSDLCEYYTENSEKMAGAVLNHSHREKGQYGNR